MALTDLLVSNPKIGIISISFFITLAMTLVTKFFTDQIRMRELKDIQKKHQEKLKEHKGNFEKQKEIQSEIMASSMEMMKHSFKPLIITFLPVILIFVWLNGFFSETAIGKSWIWWYIGSSIIFSIILRKILNVV